MFILDVMKSLKKEGCGLNRYKKKKRQARKREFGVWRGILTQCGSQRKEEGYQEEANQSTTTKMHQFNEFLEEMELLDLPMIGRRFTWHQANGTARSRLDRIEWLSQLNG